jgi:putative SOS response-associated peptidase YedK
MCGRYTHARATIDYVVPLALDRDPRLPENDHDAPSWNVHPHTHQPVIYPDATVARIRWGYLPGWAAAKGLPPFLNAKSEKLLGPWKSLTQHGRVIVPGDHWFEWIKTEDGGKQPYAVRLKSGAPLWMAGLCSVPPGGEEKERDGFLIVTAAAEAGLVDVHDRRPVVFDVAAAREWLDPGTSAEAADALAREAALPGEDFEWFPVSRDVNRSGKGALDAPYLVEPIEI